MSNNSEVAVIDIGGGRARIDAKFRTVLAELLDYAESDFAPASRGGVRHVERRRSVAVREGGRVVFPVNLVPFATRRLDAQGITFRIDGHRRGLPPPNAVDASWLGDRPAGLRDLLRACTQSPSGRVEVPPGYDVTVPVALLCLLWPGLRVVVALRNRKLVRGYLRRLGEVLGDRVRDVKGMDWSRKDRVLATTLQKAEHCKSDDWDLLLLPDAAAALAQSCELPLVTRHGVPVLGFTTAGKSFSHREQVLLTAKCGPLIHRVGDPRHDRRPVRVVAFTPPWSPSCAADALARKRGLFWHNDARNDALAAIAAAYRSNDADVLADYGLEPHPAVQEPKVAVLVESPEHGRELRERLTGWRLEAAMADDGGNAGHRPSPWRPCDRWVVTARRASRLKELPVDVVIHAGGEEAIDLKGFPPRVSPVGGEVLLVEPLDDADRAAEMATRSRLAAYRRRGWAVECPARWRR